MEKELTWKHVSRAVSGMVLYNREKEKVMSILSPYLRKAYIRGIRFSILCLTPKKLKNGVYHVIVIFEISAHGNKAFNVTVRGLGMEMGEALEGAADEFAAALDSLFATEDGRDLIPLYDGDSPSGFCYPGTLLLYHNATRPMTKNLFDHVKHLVPPYLDRALAINHVTLEYHRRHELENGKLKLCHSDFIARINDKPVHEIKELLKTYEVGIKGPGYANARQDIFLVRE